MGFSTRSLNLLQPLLFVNKWRRPLTAVLAILLLAPFRPADCPAAERSTLLPAPLDPAVVRKLVDSGSFALSRGSEPVAAYNIDAPLVPASITKIFTALAALNGLGVDHRFRTELFLDEKNDLYIKGYGDPFLVSEEVDKIFLSLKERGVERINAIYIDDSSHRLEGRADGAGDTLNPYDVACGGLAVNFNTINIVVNEEGGVASGEPQTPKLPIMDRLGAGLEPGEYRINISRDPEDVLLLAGQLFREFQRKVGIAGDGPISRRKAPDTKPLLIHLNDRKLTDIIEGLMLYSNNYIANQVFLATGAARYGYPATWLKARRAMKDYLAADPVLSRLNVRLVEGSGLSRNNRLTARAMLRGLELFSPHARLLPKKNTALVKSGTLTGVYSYAGYLPSPAGHDSFVIILNQSRNTRDALLELLGDIPR